MDVLGTLARIALGLGFVTLWAVLWGVPAITSYRAGQYGEGTLAAVLLLLPLVAVAWARLDLGLPVSGSRSRAGE